MFCYQCEQTARGTGCTAVGVCGKDARTAALQDLLIHATKGVAMYAHRARQKGAIDPDVDALVAENLFSTVTNVDFDPDRLASLVRQTAEMRDRARELCMSAGAQVDDLAGPAVWQPSATLESLVAQGEDVSILARRRLVKTRIYSLSSLYSTPQILFKR